MRRVGRAAQWLMAWMFVAAAGCSAAADQAPNIVPDEVWDRPRSGRSLIVVPAVKRVLSALAADPQATLVVRHAAGADPSGQAEELKAWIVAHAVAPERIVLRGDLPARQPMQLDIATLAKP